MKKVIGYTLYGAHPLYIFGAIENAIIGKKIFSDWIIRFYYNNSVPMFIINYLKTLDNVELLKQDEEWVDYRCVKWRFYGMIDDDIDVYLCRDIDSRLDERDKSCVDKWLKTNYNFMSIIEMGGRGAVIGGGMWGVKGNILNTNDIKKELLNKNSIYFPDTFYHKTTKHKKNDQKFLKDFVYHKVKKNYLYFYSDIHQKNVELYKSKYKECLEIPIKLNKGLGLGDKCTNYNLTYSILGIKKIKRSLFNKKGKRQEKKKQYEEIISIWKKYYPNLEI